MKSALRRAFSASDFLFCIKWRIASAIAGGLVSLEITTLWVIPAKDTAAPTAGVATTGTRRPSASVTTMHQGSAIDGRRRQSALLISSPIRRLSTDPFTAIRRGELFDATDSSFARSGPSPIMVNESPRARLLSWARNSMTGMRFFTGTSRAMIKISVVPLGFVFASELSFGFQAS